MKFNKLNFIESVCFQWRSHVACNGRIFQMKIWTVVVTTLFKSSKKIWTVVLRPLYKLEGV